jgi:hypothetical protein
MAPDGLFAAGFFELVQQLKNLIGCRAETSDDLPVVRILLELECSPGFVDEAEAFGDFLALRLGHPKHPIRRRRFSIVKPTSRVAVSVAFST